MLEIDLHAPYRCVCSVVHMVPVGLFPVVVRRCHVNDWCFDCVWKS